MENSRTIFRVCALKADSRGARFKDGHSRWFSSITEARTHMFDCDKAQADSTYLFYIESEQVPVSREGLVNWLNMTLSNSSRIMDYTKANGEREEKEDGSPDVMLPVV